MDGFMKRWATEFIALFWFAVLIATVWVTVSLFPETEPSPCECQVNETVHCWR